LVTLLFIVLLWFIRSVIEPLIIAAFIAYLINPVVNVLTRRTRWSRPVAVNLVYFVTLLVLVGTPASLTSLFFDESSQVIKDLLGIFNQLIVWLEKPVGLPGFPIDFGQLANRLTQFRATFLSTLPDQLIQLLGKTSLGAVWVVVILVAVYLFLAEWPRLREGVIGSFPEKYSPEPNELYQRVRKIWMNYLRGQILLMLIVGVAFTIAWTVLGIPGALVLGVIAGFLTLIPDVGPFVAAMLAVGVALLEGSNWSWMPASHFVDGLIVLAVYLLLITIKNFWVRPVIMGRSVQMHEALVLISILMATVLWGLLGALIIVPVLASLVIIVDYLRRRILGLSPFPSVEPFVAQATPPSGPEKIATIKSRMSRKKKG
jgi:predicted PurR-regulated permease PerM